MSTPAPAEARISSHATSSRSRLLPLTLTALGVVYGDIGTSPLYAMRECFFGSHSVPPTHENVLGVLSLIIYALVLVISIKYVVIVMRADNQGEGGILALTALVPGFKGSGGLSARLAEGRPLLIALGIFGTALLYGDGMITPAISVLGAVEGLEVATPLFTPYVVPLTVAILPRLARGVWFVDQDRVSGPPPYVVRVSRVVPRDAVASSLLHRLWAGPTQAEKAAGLRFLSSEASDFAGLRINDAGVARVRLVGGCDGHGSTIATIATELKPTLRQLPRVDWIKILDPAGTTSRPWGLSDSIPACLEP